MAEVLAEVDRHAADGGEHLREAFGQPPDRAGRLVAAWRPDGRRIWGGPLTSRDVAVGVHAGRRVAAVLWLAVAAVLGFWQR